MADASSEQPPQATTPLRPVSKLFPAVGETLTPATTSKTSPMSSLPRVQEDEEDEASGKLFDNVKGTILDSDRCISQVKASESAAVEELALKSFALIDSQAQVDDEKRNLAKAREEIKELKNVISTMELSVEKHVITSANLNIENKALKAEIRDLKNQLAISKSSQELLIDSNSALTNEVTDCRRNAEEDKVIIQSLKKDLRSYELLHQSQPSHMYSELMNQSRISLEEENIRLQDKLFILMSKLGVTKQQLMEVEEENKSEDVASALLIKADTEGYEADEEATARIESDAASQQGLEETQMVIEEMDAA